MRRTVLRMISAYYVLTGAWPIVAMRSFEAVTGRKRDRWLVKMVGALATVNGAALAVGARRGRPSPETLALALGSAAAFATVDVVYVLRRRIRPVYLADAAAELVLAALLIVAPANEDDRSA